YEPWEQVKSILIKTIMKNNLTAASFAETKIKAESSIREKVKRKFSASRQARSVAFKLAEEFGKTASMHDEQHSFVHGNYQRLKEEKIFSAAIPSELGGMGWSHSDMSFFLK